MKEIPVVKFQCELCKTTYEHPEPATACEAVPIREDKGVKVGDIVRITSGDGKGMRAQVEKVLVINKDWGHYAAKRYHHTVALDARVLGSWGNRLLTYDSYEVIAP